MNTITKSVASLVAGVAAFVVVGGGVTAALDPYVWPSAMLGLPAGLVAGTVALPLTFLALTAWTERRGTGRTAPKTRRRLRTLVAATAGFVAGGALATAALSTQALGLAAAMLFAGVPVGLLSAVVAGYLAFRSAPDDPRQPGSTAQ